MKYRKMKINMHPEETEERMVPILECHYPEDERFILLLLKTDTLYYASVCKIPDNLTVGWDNGKAYDLISSLNELPYVYFDWRGKDSPKEILKQLMQG